MRQRPFALRKNVLGLRLVDFIAAQFAQYAQHLRGPRACEVLITFAQVALTVDGCAQEHIGAVPAPVHAGVQALVIALEIHHTAAVTHVGLGGCGDGQVLRD